MGWKIKFSELFANWKQKATKLVQANSTFCFQPFPLLHSIQITKFKLIPKMSQ